MWWGRDKAGAMSNKLNSVQGGYMMPDLRNLFSVSFEDPGQSQTPFSDWTG